jgi:hypothetical protein
VGVVFKKQKKKYGNKRRYRAPGQGKSQGHRHEIGGIYKGFKDHGIVQNINAENCGEKTQEHTNNPDKKIGRKNTYVYGSGTYNKGDIKIQIEK